MKKITKPHDRDIRIVTEMEALRYRNISSIKDLLVTTGFNRLSAHSYTPAHPKELKNMVCIYNSALVMFMSPKAKKIVVPNNIPDMVYDGALRRTSFTMPHSDVIEICDDTRIIGNYYPNLNFLNICDVTHKNIGPLKVILEKIIEFNTENNISRKFTLFNKEGEITIGMDPEFALLDKDGKLVSASHLISDPLHKAGVGLDGFATIGELRPKPSKTPRGLIKNIKNLYTDLSKIVEPRDIKVYTGSGSDVGVSLGGHIHFGGMQPSTELLLLLDDFIGVPLKNSKFGNRSDYGGLSSYEIKPYGFEYRTPPSFIGNKSLTEGVLSVAICLANTIKNLAEEGFSYNDSPTKEDYMKLHGAEKYSKAINYFVDFTNNKENTLSTFDVMAAWRIKHNEERTATI